MLAGVKPAERGYDAILPSRSQKSPVRLDAFLHPVQAAPQPEGYAAAHSLVAPANIPVTSARWAKRKTTKTGAIVTSVAIASSGRRTGLTACAATGLNADVEDMRYCRATGSGYCLSL